MNNNKCHICGCLRSIHFCTIDEYTLVKCQGCGIVFLNPQPTIEELNRLYSKMYHMDRVLHKEFNSVEDIEEKVEQNTNMASMITRRFGSEGKLLDVGCGAGFFLAALKRRGWSVTGVDVSKWASQFAIENFQIMVYTGAIDCIDTALNFDVVTMFHALEHIPDPLGALCQIRQHLYKDGYLIVKGPNFGSIDRIWHGVQWRGYQLPFHLFHFTSSDYRRIIEKAGFQIEDIRYSYWNPLDHLLAIDLKNTIRADYSTETIASRVKSKIGEHAVSVFLRKGFLLLAMFLGLRGRDVTIIAKKRTA